MKYALISTLLLLCFTACKKNKKQNAEPETIIIYQVKNGKISGKVTLYQADGPSFTGSAANVTVSINNQTVVAVTDEAGKYTINDVAPGTLDINFKAPDGSGTLAQQIKFVGNGTLLVDQMFSLRNNDTIVGRINDSLVDGQMGVFLRCRNNNSASKKQTPIAIIVSTLATANAGEPSTFSQSYQGYLQLPSVSASGAGFQKFFSYATIAKDAGFEKGQEFFINAYPVGTFGGYEDVNLRKFVNKSAGKAMIVPTSFLIK